MTRREEDARHGDTPPPSIGGSGHRQIVRELVRKPIKTLFFYLQDNGGCAGPGATGIHRTSRAPAAVAAPTRAITPRRRAHRPTATVHGQPRPGPSDTCTPTAAVEVTSTTPFASSALGFLRGGISTPAGGSAKQISATGELDANPGLIDIMATCVAVANAAIRQPPCRWKARACSPHSPSNRCYFYWEHENAPSATATGSSSPRRTRRGSCTTSPPIASSQMTSPGKCPPR